MVPKTPRSDKTQATTMVDKEVAPNRLIMSERGHPTGMVADLAEKQFDEYVRGLFYIYMVHRVAVTRGNLVLH